MEDNLVCAALCKSIPARQGRSLQQEYRLSALVECTGSEYRRKCLRISQQSLYTMGHMAAMWHAPA